MSTKHYVKKVVADFDALNEEIGYDNVLYELEDTGDVYRWDAAKSVFSIFGGRDAITDVNETDEDQVYFVRLATTGALAACTYDNGTGGVGATLTGNVNGIVGQINSAGLVDTKVVQPDDLILVKDQSDKKQNGIYEVTQPGDGSTQFVLTRVAYYDSSSEVYPSIIFVTEGSGNINRYFNQSTPAPVIGTSNLVFAVARANDQVLPTIFMDTVTSSALPSCAYQPGTIYPVTLPGHNAKLIATANGSLGSINGVSMSSGKRVIVKDQANEAHNGIYHVTKPGSATQKWELTRLTAYSSGTAYKFREFVVSNPDCLYYGNRYTLTSPLNLTNAQIGTVPLTFAVNMSNLWQDDGTYLTPNDDTRSIKVATSQSVGIENTITTGGLVSQPTGSSTWIIEIGSYIVVSDYNSSVNVFDKSTFSPAMNIPAPGAYGLVFDPINSRLIIGSYYAGLMTVVNIGDVDNILTWNLDYSAGQYHIGVTDVLCYNPVNDKIYAYNYSNEEIIVFNNDSLLTVDRTISVPLSFSQGWYIDCNTNNGDVYIAARNGNIVAFDINDVEVVNIVPVIDPNNWIEGLKYSPDTDKIYVSNSLDDITVIDGTTRTAVANIQISDYYTPIGGIQYCYRITNNDGKTYIIAQDYSYSSGIFVFEINGDDTLTLIESDSNIRNYINIDGVSAYTRSNGNTYYTTPAVQTVYESKITNTSGNDNYEHDLPAKSGTIAHLSDIPVVPPQFIYPVSTSLIAYVEPTYGGDYTAVIGDITKPFQTVYAAQYALESYIITNHGGDPDYPRLVYLLPGRYTENFLLISNARYYAPTGVTLVMQGGQKFYIGGNTVNCKWYGEADVIEPTNFNTDFLRLENPFNYQIDIEVNFNNFYAPNGTGIFFLSRRSTANTDWIRLNYNQLYIQNSSQTYVINPRLYLNVEINAKGDTISGGGLFFGGGANGYMGTFIYNGKNIITKGSSAPSVRDTVYLSQTVDDAGYIEINANLINERDTNLATAVVVSAQSMFIKNVIINGNIIGKTCKAIQMHGNRSTYAGEFEVNGDIISEVSNAILFTNNANVTNGLTFRHNGGRIESPSGFNNVQLDTASCYTIALYQSRLKSLGASDVNLDLIIDAFYSSGLNVFLYDCLLESQSSECINATNPLAINSVNSKSNKAVDVNISDNWEGIDVYPTFTLK